MLDNFKHVSYFAYYFQMALESENQRNDDIAETYLCQTVLFRSQITFGKFLFLFQFHLSYNSILKHKSTYVTIPSQNKTPVNVIRSIHLTLYRRNYCLQIARIWVMTNSTLRNKFGKNSLFSRTFQMLSSLSTVENGEFTFFVLKMFVRFSLIFITIRMF